MEKDIAVVTGANRGIGLEICRQLAQAGLYVILTARDGEKGIAAVKQLHEEGLDVTFHPLDVANKESIEALVSYLTENYTHIDILINNAGVLPGNKDTQHVTEEELRQTMETNFFGPFMLSQALLPQLKKSFDARIINVSSGMGAFAEMSGGHAAYRISKTALNSLTFTMAHDLIYTNIKVYAMCPGWVRTDMGGKGAPKSVRQGADTAVWLATANGIHTGRFYRDRKEIKW